MKILFLHKWLVMGGIEKILINYLSLLSKNKNVKVDLVIHYDTPNNVFGDTLPQIRNVKYIYTKDYFIKKTSLYNRKKENLLIRVKEKLHKLKEKKKTKDYINKLINNGSYDIVINFSNHFDDYILNQKHKTPIIRWQHLALNTRNKKQISKEIIHLKKYEKIITLCEDMADEIANITKITREKIFVLPNPINLNDISNKSREDVPKEHYELINRSYFIQVARLDKIKQHELMINIYSKLAKQGVKENLYILGGGDEFSSLKQLINELGLQNKCFLFNEVANPYPYMKNATFFLHTSEREGLPTVLLESLALSVPVIAMNCPTGPREILDNGKCGILVELNNQQAFIDAVILLLQQKEKIEEYRKNMKERVTYYSEENVSTSFYQLIEKITKKGT